MADSIYVEQLVETGSVLLLPDELLQFVEDAREAGVPVDYYDSDYCDPYLVLTLVD